ncbi:MAG: aminoacyl-histidine dipeptidase [Gaiellaceae bacterium]|nr:MAG: aminoacyl-histidine dipeptidase [Gaiellaceae bacterium]
MAISASTLRLEPEALWRRFLELTTIPRPSKQEAAARDHILAWAHGRSFPVAVDAAGNVVVRVSASPGRESAPTVCLQAHLDMVCERDPLSPHDAREGRIRVVREDDWLAAEGTTLGADNGIGVALALATAEDPSVEHGPLELLFTVCEEQGLEGAKGLDPALLAARLLVNLDGTSDDAITVGCAGSAHVVARIPLERTELHEGHGLVVELAGGRGGHSGGDIHRGRANAITALGRLLDQARATAPIRLVELAGGVSRNAIPREARAQLALAPRDEGAVREAITNELARLRNEHASSDALTATIRPERIGLAGSADATTRALGLLRALPNGVVSFAAGLEDVVETSTSLTVARTEDGTLVLASMARSSSGTGLEDIVTALERVAAEHGAEVESRRSYRPWEPDLDSSLLAAAQDAYRRLFGSEPRLEVVHGGLECAVIREKLPGVQMISLGPAILGPHAPGERVSITGTQRVYALLKALLDDLSR